MDFLLSHWHCILPVLGIGMILLLQHCGKQKDKGA
jgi:hypothetical protein